MKVVVVLAGTVAVLVVLGWLGLQIGPRPFPVFSQQQPPAPETVPLPQGLPAPVERFYRRIYGEKVPMITSAVISGRAKMRIGGMTFPARFRFTHDAGRGYRHYIEATFFGLPAMRVNEWYLDGEARLELPFGLTEGEPRVNQAGNMGLWAESVWLPSTFITDPRVHWAPVDEVSALLEVPFGAVTERFVVRFDPQTGLVRFLEAMRYKDAASPAKTLWLNEVRTWETVDGYTVPTIGTATWFDEGSPWAVFHVEELVYNVDVQAYVRAKGP